VISAAYPYAASRVSMGPYVVEKKKKARSQSKQNDFFTHIHQGDRRGKRRSGIQPTCI